MAEHSIAFNSADDEFDGGSTLAACWNASEENDAGSGQITGGNLRLIANIKSDENEPFWDYYKPFPTGTTDFALSVYVAQVSRTASTEAHKRQSAFLDIHNSTEGISFQIKRNMDHDPANIWLLTSTDEDDNDTDAYPKEGGSLYDTIGDSTMYVCLDIMTASRHT